MNQSLTKKQFNKVNNLLGWSVFLISLIVYVMTMEETASFWDCSEFIAVSYKLMVPHPPGTPLYLLINRFFSFLAFGDVEKVAYWINFSSALMSALTILFMHWSIVLVGMRFLKPNEKGGQSLKNTLLLMGGGVIGSLIYTFSDSFWFSAVEAEVYAISSFLTAIAFWAVLRIQFIEDEATVNRWILLIAYILGLSIGIHLMILLVIPALALAYYFKKNPNGDLKGSIIALVIGSGILLVVNGAIPGLPVLAGKFEIFFINSMGMPFGSGAFIFTILLIGGVVYGIYYSHKVGNSLMNTAFLSAAFILIGYTSYAVIVIRSNYEPPIDENDPGEDIMSLVSYLKREQYGYRPLIYGPHFMAEQTQARTEKEREAREKDREPVYRMNKEKGIYEIYDYRSTERYYDSKDMMLFPRMYSGQGNHPDLYREWTGLAKGQSPDFFTNLEFFFKYQLGHMYLRYFFWNFVGRDSDEKDAGVMMPFDSKEHKYAMAYQPDGSVGFSQVDLPEELVENKARNNFYMLPFILGLVGMFFHYNRDKRGFWVMTILFVITGIALVVYLNSPPVEPRERDYIYVGSFYVFAMWAGLGVMALADRLGKALSGASAPIAATALCAIVPLIMAASGWSNHNRSNRWHSIDQARNTLASCAPNAILFTGGDNDTFPLWYIQNVEGFRTDVRVAVLSYFSTDWYLNQMRNKEYESDALPFSISEHNYRAGKNDYVPLVPDERAKGGINAKTFVNLVNKNHPMVQVGLSDGSSTAKLLSDTFVLDVDKEKIKSLGAVPKEKEDRIVDKMVWSLRPGRRHIFKNELALLDLIVSSNWERPIYFNNTSSQTIAMDLRKYLQLEGMTFRLMPIVAEQSSDVGEVNTSKMLENVKNFRFREMNNEAVYYDDEYRKFGANTRNNFYRLAEDLYYKDRDEEAKAVMDSILNEIPDKTIPYSFFAPKYVELYHKLGDHEKANEIAETIARRSSQNVNYAAAIRDKSTSSYGRSGLMILQQLAMLYRGSLQAEKERLTLLESAVDRGEDLQLPKEEYNNEVEITKELIKLYTEKEKEYSDKFGEAYKLLYGNR
ncbi:glycosyltransferase family 117 protein [Sediminitomix flava]|uniref:Putative membrane protein YfcA n=1 Tax=Sediminitomix flava TaxID=379075 RepID=A0A315Z9Y8_SEDFL|nr:DUF2723 domain-containing protein [Sediminitomix flava]PWJ40890.1 putative membrane protein YfcA [Sediminitomix flava]